MSDTAHPGIRRLIRADAAALRRLRLDGLGRHPEAFGSSLAEGSRLTIADFAEMIDRPDPDAVFGAFIGPDLVGMARFLAETGDKTRHRGRLLGVYVRQEAAGRGLGEGLVRAVIDQARRHVTVLLLGVAVDNGPARRLYRRLGFEPYGLDRRALKVGGRYIDEELCAMLF